MYRLLDVECGDYHLVRCLCRAELSIGEGDACVFEADGIKEFGKVCSVTELAGKPDVKRLPVVLRRATLQDQSQASENVLFLKSSRRLCEEKILELKLPMSVVRIRVALDRSRMVIDFTADERVDFRQLVHALNAATRSRVELRQIGVRDAAGIIGGMAPCGRRLCCSEWLKEFENVHVKMARVQGLSLSPNAINGMCGRLKCCLRFEHNCYKDLARKMPLEGAKIRTERGNGKVMEVHLLSQRVKALMDDNSIQILEVDEIKTLGSS